MVDEVAFLEHCVDEAQRNEVSSRTIKILRDRVREYTEQRLRMDEQAAKVLLRHLDGRTEWANDEERQRYIRAVLGLREHFEHPEDAAEITTIDGFPIIEELRRVTSAGQMQDGVWYRPCEPGVNGIMWGHRDGVYVSNKMRDGEPGLSHSDVDRLYPGRHEHGYEMVPGGAAR